MALHLFLQCDNVSDFDFFNDDKRSTKLQRKYLSVIGNFFVNYLNCININIKKKQHDLAQFKICYRIFFVTPAVGWKGRFTYKNIMDARRELQT